VIHRIGRVGPGRVGALRLPALICAAAFAGLFDSGSLEAQTNRPELLNVRFEGNEAFPDDSLAVAIINRPTECRFWFVLPFCWAGAETFIDRQYLEPRQLPLDSARLRVYYAARGYRSARVGVERTPDESGMRLTFNIDEGEPIRVDSIGFIGLDEVEVQGLTENLALRQGDPLSEIRIDGARDTLIARLQNNGYAHAEVLIDQFVPTGGTGASVDFIFDPGPIVRYGPITVEGNAVLSETSVRRMVPFRTGGLYRRRELVEGQRNLYSLELVRLAEVRAQPALLDTIAPVTIRVQEGDVHRVRTALGWSTSDCVNTEALWASRNFRGGARRLQVRGRLSNILAPELNQSVCPQTGSGDFADLNGQLSVELVQPWIFSPRNSLSANAFIERQSLPDVFIREAIGLNLTLSRVIGRGASMAVSYEPQIARLEAAEIFFCSSFRACTQNDIELFRASNWLAPLGLAVSLDRTDRILDPSRGWQAQLDLEHASDFTASDFAYNRATGAVSTYLQVGGGTVLALRSAGGIVGEGEFVRIEGTGRTGLIHPEKRLYSGGASSVRGYAENRLGPRVLSVEASSLLSSPEEGAPAPCTPDSVFDATCDVGSASDGLFTSRPTGGSRLFEANAELRVPLQGGRFQVVGFVDVGQVWAENDPTQFRDLEVTPGLGFRYFSPIGPIRVDVGLRPRQVESLPVISSGLRPFDPQSDALGDRISVRTASGQTTPIDWVATRDLIFLDSPFAFGEPTGFLSRLQLHISIGQAF